MFDRADESLGVRIAIWRAWRDADRIDAVVLQDRPKLVRELPVPIHDQVRALVQEGVMVRPAFHLPQHIRATIGNPDDNTRLLVALYTILGN